MNRRAFLFLLVGLVAAVAAAVVVYMLLRNTQQQNEAAQQQLQQTPVAEAPTPVPVKQVLVAVTDIQANTVVTAAEVVTTYYPANLVPADAITSTAQVLNTTARTAVFSGQILLQRQFLAAEGHTGASIVIPPGKVLVAFPSTDMLNATGAVQAGDHVDIMLTIPISGTTRVDTGTGTGSQLPAGAPAIVTQGTLQDIEVYSIGLWTPPGQQAANPNNNPGAGLKVITFVVDHQEALILKYVKDSGGTIDLAVRSAADNKIVQTDPVSIDYLVDLYGFVALPRAKPATP